MNFNKSIGALLFVLFLVATGCQKEELSINSPIDTDLQEKNNIVTLSRSATLYPNRTVSLMRSSRPQNVMAHFENLGSTPVRLRIYFKDPATGRVYSKTKTLEGENDVIVEYLNVTAVTAFPTNPGSILPILAYEIKYNNGHPNLDWLQTNDPCPSGDMALEPDQYIDCLWEYTEIFSSVVGRDLDLEFEVTEGDHSVEVRITSSNNTYQIITVNAPHYFNGQLAILDVYDIVKIEVRGEKSNLSCSEAKFSYDICYQ